MSGPRFQGDPGEIAAKPPPILETLFPGPNLGYGCLNCGAFQPIRYRAGNGSEYRLSVAEIMVNKEGAVNFQWPVRDFRATLGKSR